MFWLPSALGNSMILRLFYDAIQHRKATKRRVHNQLGQDHEQKDLFRGSKSLKSKNHPAPRFLPPPSLRVTWNQGKRNTDHLGQSDRYTISWRHANYVIGSAAYNIYIYVTALICLNYKKNSYWLKIRDNDLSTDTHF